MQIEWNKISWYAKAVVAFLVFGVLFWVGSFSTKYFRTDATPSRENINEVPAIVADDSSASQVQETGSVKDEAMTVPMKQKVRYEEQTFDFFNETSYAIKGRWTHISGPAQPYEQSLQIDLIDKADGATVMADMFKELKAQIEDFPSDAIMPLSFPKNSNALFFAGTKLGTEGNEYPLVAFDVSRKIFSTLDTASRLHGKFQLQAISPDGTRIAEVLMYPDTLESSQKLYVLSLVDDSANVVVDLSGGNFSFVDQCTIFCGGSLVWVDADTVEYGVYDAADSRNTPTDAHPRPLVEKRRVDIGQF